MFGQNLFRSVVETVRIERVIGQAAWRCKNKNSFIQKKRKLYHFVSKQAFNIEGLGPKIIHALLTAELHFYLLMTFLPSKEGFAFFAAVC